MQNHKSHLDSRKNKILVIKVLKIFGKLAVK